MYNLLQGKLTFSTIIRGPFAYHDKVALERYFGGGTRGGRVRAPNVSRRLGWIVISPTATQRKRARRIIKRSNDEGKHSKREHVLGHKKNKQPI